ncbi:hypothetical protein BX600DRAFT_174713 [Xylariales sp. PMI_506]|nr:hypothetical protein BX600DRAFT_174713 [Xylariales sp. PMI_506]
MVFKCSDPSSRIIFFLSLSSLVPYPLFSTGVQALIRAAPCPPFEGDQKISPRQSIDKRARQTWQGSAGGSVDRFHHLDPENEGQLGEDSSIVTIKNLDHR